MSLLNGPPVCSKEDALDSECSTKLTASGNKFSETRLSLELPLKLAGKTLQTLDSDLAEFAAQLLKEAQHCAESIETIVRPTGTCRLDEIRDKPDGGIDPKNESEPPHELANEKMTASDLHAQLQSLRQRILYLTLCTEVVDDVQFMMYTQEQHRRGARATHEALEHLHEASASLKVLIKWV